MRPISRSRSRFESRKRLSCSVASYRKSRRSSSASPATSRSATIRGELPADLLTACSWLVHEVRAHPLAQEDRVLRVEDRFGNPVAEAAHRRVLVEPIEDGVVRQVKDDDVVPGRALGHVEPADESDAVLLLRLSGGARKDVAHAA